MNTDYQLTLTKHMYLQQMLAEAFIDGTQSEANATSRPGTLRIVIISDNARSLQAPKSSAIKSTAGRAKYGKGRNSAVRTSRRSSNAKFNQTLAKLEVCRWQSILLSKAQRQAQKATSDQELDSSSGSLGDAPQRPRRRGSMECRPRFPRRQASIVGLDESNHSQVAANAA